MNRHLICTVGTSLLTNRDDRPWAPWLRAAPLPDLSTLTEWLATADPTKASAETNTLAALDVDDGDVIVLLHSATPEGLRCAEALAAQYDKSCNAAVLREIGDLGYGAERFTTGLKALVDRAITAVREGRAARREVVFCATGGFKAEIAFLNLLGALLEIEVVYLHEQHRALVRLPRLPLVWDAELVRRHARFFEWIDEAPRRSAEVESWLRGNPELRNLVEDDDDGDTFLSAAGTLLYQAAKESLALGPRVVWPETYAAPPAEKNRVSTEAHHRPPGWDRFVGRLCAIDCVKSVRYDAAAHGGPAAKVLEPDLGAIGVRFGSVGQELPLRVETTARGLEQCDLVAEYLRRLR